MRLISIILKVIGKSHIYNMKRFKRDLKLKDEILALSIRFPTYYNFYNQNNEDNIYSNCIVNK